MLSCIRPQLHQSAPPDIRSFHSTSNSPSGSSSGLPDKDVDFVISIGCKEVRLGLVDNVRAKVFSNNDIPGGTYRNKRYSNVLEHTILFVHVLLDFISDKSLFTVVLKGFVDILSKFFIRNHDIYLFSGIEHGRFHVDNFHVELRHFLSFIFFKL